MVMPMNSTVTTYGGLQTAGGSAADQQLGNGGGGGGELSSKARRVQQQVQMRLAEKQSTLPRQQNGGHYATSEYGGSSTTKFQTYNPGFTSKSSYMYTGSRPAMARPMSQYSSGMSGGYTSRSAVDLNQLRMSTVGGGGGGGGYHTSIRQQGGGGGGYTTRLNADTLSLHSMRQHPQFQVNEFNCVEPSDAGSMVSDRDYGGAQGGGGGGMNGYGGAQVRLQQQRSVNSAFPMRRSLSGTLSSRGGMMMVDGGGGGGGGDMEVLPSQFHSFKGPAYRTISRINNRNTRMSSAMTTQSSQMHQSAGGGGGFIMDNMGSQGNLAMMQPGRLSRAMSVKSFHSVGRGHDIFDGGMVGSAGSMGNLSGIASLDMSSAVEHLKDSDPALQVLGAAYIQHECYNNAEAKQEVRRYKGIGELVKLFNCDNQEVQRYATGATRNLIYESMENKVSLIEEGGIPQLVEALRENDDELRKNITGILWNLSSKDNLKEKLARETLPELTEKILVPLAGEDDEPIQHSASEADIFYNTTGCLRNLSSVNEKTRQQMRETHGLVDALVTYIKGALEANKAEDKGVENAVCVLRNLSYQLYSEMPPSALLRLEGPTRAQDTGVKSDAIGCFTPKSRKAKNRKNQDVSTFTEVARVPKGVEWLWHPQVVGLYNRVLKQCEINATTREAASGALQNITAGDKRWASVLSRVALDQERMLPVLLDNLRTTSDLELRSLTGFLRNLSRHAADKNDMATKVVNNLVTLLPSDGQQKDPSSDVVVNICGILNNLVTASALAARDVTFFDGLAKLVGIKNSHDNSPGRVKAAKAAATVLCNMFQYKKLHKSYKQKGFTRPDFADMTI